MLNFKHLNQIAERQLNIADVIWMLLVHWYSWGVWRHTNNSANSFLGQEGSARKHKRNLPNKTFLAVRTPRERVSQQSPGAEERNNKSGKKRETQRWAVAYQAGQNLSFQLTRQLLIASSGNRNQQLTLDTVTNKVMVKLVLHHTIINKNHWCSSTLYLTRKSTF